MLLRSRFVGKYEVTGLAGTGGMGAVYRARNPDTQSNVAIKVMHASCDDSGQQRFKREAAALADLTTQHVVRIFDFGEEENGTPFLVMEFLHGHTLRNEIRAPPDLMAVQRIDMVMDGALRGLAAAHRAGIVHRDLKPENIFIAKTDDGEVTKVLDFGIARVTSKTDQVLTQSGAIMGTPAYMGPEQVSASSGKVGPHSDTYAVGVILYEMLTGIVPFFSDSMANVLNRVLSRDFEPLRKTRSGLPEAVYDLCSRALAGDVASRFADAEEMHAAWAKAYADFGQQTTTTPRPRFVADSISATVDPHSDTDVAKPVLSTSPTRVGHMRPQSKGSPRIGVVAGIAMLTVVAGTVAAYLLWPRSNRPAAALVDARLALVPVPNDAKVTPKSSDDVLFAGGSFKMGLDHKRFADYPNADPRHEVTLAAFYLDKTEVTAKGSDRPMRNISWHDAAQICEERGKRLPSEAEWEFAATRVKLSVDDARLLRPGVSGPTEVATHPGDCTPKGVCDLLGNVAEWTTDPWRAADSTPDPQFRTIRGASYAVSPNQVFYASPWARTKLTPDSKDPEVGFRCARDAQ